MFLVATLAIGFTRVLHPSGTGGTTLCSKFFAHGGLTSHQKSHNCNFEGTGPKTWSTARSWDYLQCDANLNTKVLFFEHTFAAEFPCDNVKHIMLMRQSYWIWRLHLAAKNRVWQKADSNQRCNLLLTSPPFVLINYVLGRHIHAVATTTELSMAIKRINFIDLIVITEHMSDINNEIEALTGISITKPHVHQNSHHNTNYTVADDCKERFERDRLLDLKLHAHIINRSHTVASF